MESLSGSFGECSTSSEEGTLKGKRKRLHVEERCLEEERAKMREAQQKEELINHKLLPLQKECHH